MERFVRRAHPNSLSVRDLLDARDHYHVHLANLPTVQGTAIGRYRIRREDPDFKEPVPEHDGNELGPRTLRNSDFRDWSWPCVLVFVNKWLDKETLAKRPEMAVPPLLYLPDGRQVRTCPILVEQRERNLPAAETAVYAASKFGPNFQVYVEDQGATRMGVASAIVEDGACAYVLVSRHLTSGADSGKGVFALPRNKRETIGYVTARSVNSVPLENIYPGFGGRNAELTLDVSLVKLANVGACTTQYLGVGTMGRPIDLSADTMSLNLIGCPVFTELPGNVRVEGKVQALFYRHTSVGGVDALAEILIGPRDSAGSIETRPGDSGAVWFWDDVADHSVSDKASKKDIARSEGDSSKARDASNASRAYRAFCVQWGGGGFSSASASGTTEFALGTSLSSVCKALSVDVVEDWASGQSRYWGKVGHYNIGYAACFALQSERASIVFEANARSIGVSDDDIVAGNLPSAVQKTKFIALADVPDLVWRQSRGMDKANHFADMDEEGKGEFEGKTLLQLWKSKANRTPQVWNEFYESIDPSREPAHRGALPFRVAQLFDVMVAAVKANELNKYVCAAGVLAHYIGDACQPLHVSYLHHGLPDDSSDDKVHAVYEDDMLNHAAADVVAGVKSTVASLGKQPLLDDGMAAADAVVQLMQRTIKTLAPEEVLDVYNRVRGNSQSADMWGELGDRTIECMADGAVTLATVWQSAWTRGGGDTSPFYTKTVCATAINKMRLKTLYDDRTFAESLWLKDM